MFGDLEITSDSGTEIVRRLEALAGDSEQSGKLRLAGLRKVMTEHTYQHRLAYVAHKALRRPPRDPHPPILVLAEARSASEVELLLAHFARQTYGRRRLLVALHAGLAPSTFDVTGVDPRVAFIRAAELTVERLRISVAPEGWIAGWAAEDYYGPN